MRSRMPFTTPSPKAACPLPTTTAGSSEIVTRWTGDSEPSAPNVPSLNPYVQDFAAPQLSVRLVRLHIVRLAK